MYFPCTFDDKNLIRHSHPPKEHIIKFLLCPLSHSVKRFKIKECVSWPFGLFFPYKYVHTYSVCPDNLTCLEATSFYISKKSSPLFFSLSSCSFIMWQLMKKKVHNYMRAPSFLILLIINNMYGPSTSCCCYI